MKLIQILSEKIEEELGDACSYIDLAMEYADTDKLTADVFAQLSAEEITHSEKLHSRVVAVIEAYRKEHGDPPPEMQWRYEYLHKKHINKALEIKVKQALYKEGTK